MTYQSMEIRLKELGQMVQLLATMIEDLGRNVDAIYKELDMVDEESPITSTYDFCDCDKHYGHMCEYTDRI